MIKKTLLFVFTLGCLVSCNQNKLEKNAFQVDATLKGIEDNSLVILIEKGNHIVDSSRVVNKKAVFKGKIEEPKKVMLTVRGTQNYKHFWIEPNYMTLEAESGKFRQAKITGSRMQGKNDEYNARLKPFEKIQAEIEEYANEFGAQLNQKQIDSLSITYNKAEKDEEYETMSFIRENSSHLLSAYLLDFYARTFGRDSVKSLFLNLNKDLQKTNYGISILEYLKLNKQLALGDSFPHVTLQNVNDELKSSSDLKSKYLLIEVWASDCQPCRITNPKLVNIYKKYNSKGFDIYGISLDTEKDEWVDAIKKDGLLWENVVDLTGRAGNTANKFGISAIPHNYLLDHSGKVIAINIWSEDLEKKLESLLP